MAGSNADLRALVERLSAAGEELSKSVAALEKLDVDWTRVPSLPEPLGLADQACTQNNQCEPNPQCTQNHGC
jgi:hypothetical protein